MTTPVNPLTEISNSIGFPVEYHGELDPPGYWLMAPQPELLGRTITDAIRVGRERVQELAPVTPGITAEDVIGTVERALPMIKAYIGRFRSGTGQASQPGQPDQRRGSTPTATDGLPE